MPDIGFIIRLFLRRLHHMVLIALPIVTFALWLALNLPPSYSAEARLLVESPQVPSDLAASTMRIETTEVLRVLQQQLLARNNMLQLSREFDLHVDNPELSANDIVDDMRARTTVDLPSPRDPAAFVTLSFRAGDPVISANVVDALVTRLTSDYARLRTSTTEQTLDFFDAEVARLKEELDAQTARIVDFQESNKNALPDSLAYRRARQTSLQERLVQVDRELSSLRDRRARMVAMFEQTGRLPGNAEQLSPEQAELEELRRQLSRLRAVYAPDNPRLRNIERRVEALESDVAASAAGSEGGAPVSLLDLQLADIDAQMDFLTEQKARIEVELAQLEVTIRSTPSNAVTLNALERDLANIQRQYDQAVARRAEARTGQRVEAQSQGRRLTLVEPPVPPDSPTAPNQKLIVAAGVAAGGGLAVAIIGAIELLNASVRRPVEITRAMGIAPYASLPFLRTRRQILLRRGGIAVAFVLAVAAIPAGLWAVNTYYMPLDLVMEKVANRTGLDAVRAMLRDATG